jgi:hypothetical protein
LYRRSKIHHGKETCGMRDIATVVVLICMLFVAAIPGTGECGSSMGGGIHYLKTLGSIKDTPDWDPDAIGFLVSYQYEFTLLRVEADVEWIPDYGGTDEALIQPQAWALIGESIYGGAGIGIGYWDGDWQDNPFYAIRAGVDLGLGPVALDAYASYRFQTSKVFEDINEDDLDALTFAAIVRFDF